MMNKTTGYKNSKTMLAIGVIFRAALVSAVSCAAASANLIVDGGFELPVVGPGG